jgi:uncharacterized phage protein gp47/JayE
MSFGLTSTGFKRKRLADIKTEIEDSLKLTLGQNINLLSQSLLSQFVGIFAEREALLWELAENTYNSQYPDTAEGTALDNVSSLSGVTRLGAKKTRIPGVILAGDAGTTVPAGTIFSVAGSPSNRFMTLEGITLDGVGAGEVECEALVTGPVVAPVGTLTEIDTPVTGLDSVTNPEEAILGRNVETDQELRLRRLDSLERAGSSTVEAIRARLKEVQDVGEVIIFENTTMVVDSEGLPAKSFRAYVQGGDEDEIAEAIWKNKPAGIQTSGDIEKVVVDSQGVNQTVFFSRPVELQIYIDITITKDTSPTSEWPLDGEDQVREALAEYVNSLSIGQDVVVYPKLIAALNDIPGIDDVVLAIGTAASPTLDDNIVVEINEIALIDDPETQISVTVEP